MNHNAKLVLDAERQEASAAAAAAAAEKAARPKVSAGDMFAEMAAEEKRMCKQYAEKRHGATVIADFNRPASSGAGDKKKKKKKKSTKKAVAYKLPQTTVRRTDDADAGAGGAGVPQCTGAASSSELSSGLDARRGSWSRTCFWASMTSRRSLSKSCSFWSINSVPSLQTECGAP